MRSQQPHSITGLASARAAQAEEAAAVRELLLQGWGVSPGERYRFHSAPGIRLTTADLEPDEAERLAGSVAALRTAPASAYAG